MSLASAAAELLKKTVKVWGAPPAQPTPSFSSGWDFYDGPWQNPSCLPNYKSLHGFIYTEK